MSRFTIRVSGAVILCGTLAATIPARGDDRSADAILKEIDAIKVPEIDDSREKDSAYFERFNKEKSEATNRRAPLIGALYRADPDHPKLATLLPERWEALAEKIGSPDDKKLGKDLIAELNASIAKANSAELKMDAAYWKAQVASTIAKDSTAKIKAIDEFIALAPKDERGAELLFELGSLFLEFEPAEQKALYARIVKEYPDSSEAATARGKVRQFDAVGKPFDLEFTDAISGSQITMKGLKGKVVVIGFWTTDCPTKMPTKKLYAESKDKGVEFIGVSLDEKVGGLEKLKAFVAKEGISWPQYFQGDGWESKFSVSWGIDIIPAVFVVDQQGKLFSVEYSAEDELETMITELLSGRLATTTPARGDDRSAAAILKETDAITMPAYDHSRREDSAYMERYYKEKSQATKRKADLIGALHRADPDNPELATLLPMRWEALASLVQGRHGKTVAKDLTGELNEVIARAKSDELKKDAAYWKAEVASSSAKDSAATTKAIDEFIALAPKDERGEQLLFHLSYSLEDEPDEQKALYARIIKEYPAGPWAELARGSLRRLDAVGKPFELAFTDALSGSKISMKGLKGKVVVIDFWATWCGPCVAEMPTLRKLYAEYKDKGVEFIGVNLDEKVGGLEQLKALVTKEGIAWPQYFQGDGSDSKFSTSWGINAIPTVFLVDQQGKLVSVEARGKLETMIPELLNRPVPKTGGDGGR